MTIQERYRQQLQIRTCFKPLYKVKKIRYSLKLMVNYSKITLSWFYLLVLKKKKHFRKLHLKTLISKTVYWKCSPIQKVCQQSWLSTRKSPSLAPAQGVRSAMEMVSNPLVVFQQLFSVKLPWLFWNDKNFFQSSV